MFNSLDEALLCLAEGDYVIDITDDDLSPESREVYFMLRFFTDYLDKTDSESLINSVKYPFIDWLDGREIDISEVFVDCNLVEIEDSNDLTLDSYLTPYGCMMFALYRKFVLNKNAVFDFFCDMYGLPEAKKAELVFRFNFSNHKNSSLVKAVEILEQHRLKTVKKTKKVNLESDVVTKLINREKLKCKREVSTPTGRIDILTDSELIEVKEYSNYKSAIGQLICYGNSYPEHKLRLHLFNVKDKNVDHIKLICDNLDIKLTFE